MTVPGVHTAVVGWMQLSQPHWGLQVRVPQLPQACVSPAVQVPVSAAQSPYLLTVPTLLARLARQTASCVPQCPQTRLNFWLRVAQLSPVSGVLAVAAAPAGLGPASLFAPASPAPVGKRVSSSDSSPLSGARPFFASAGIVIDGSVGSTAATGSSPSSVVALHPTVAAVPRTPAMEKARRADLRIVVIGRRL